MILIYSFLSLVDYIIYSLAASMLRLIVDIANVEFFEADKITAITSRIYVVIGVVMLFKLIISGVQYLINPDVFDDKEKGLSGLLTRSIISLALLVLVPILFRVAISVQKPIIEALPNFVFGTEKRVDFGNDSVGREISFQVLSAFVSVREGHENQIASTEKISDLPSFHSNIMAGCPAVSLFGLFGSYDSCHYDYKIIISTAAGAFLCYVLLTMILDVAIRTIKFTIIQILAPVPIIGYVFSKDKLNQFIKMAVKVYLDLFIRMAIIYFIVFTIKNLFDRNIIASMADGDAFRTILVSIALIFGLLMFAQKAPKFITDLLGLKDVTSDEMSDMFKPAWQRVGGFSAAGAAIGAYRNAKDFGDQHKWRRAFTAGAHATGVRLRDIASGKSLEESYKTAKDAASARTLRNLEYANRYPNVRERQRQVWQEKWDKYTGVTTGGKKASGTIAAANTLLEGRSHSWNRAEAKVLEAPGKYSRKTTITLSGAKAGTTLSIGVSEMLTRMKELEGNPSLATYDNEYQDLVNNRQKILDTAKQEFIERSFSDLSGDGQQRNVFAEDVFKFLRSGGDPKIIGGALTQTFPKKDADGNVILDAYGNPETVTFNLKEIANKVAAGETLDEYEARAVAEYIATKMNNEGGRMRVQATQTQTTEPKSS